MYLSGVLGLAPAIQGKVGPWLSPGHTERTVEQEDVSWQFVSFLTRQVNWDLWIIEVCELKACTCKVQTQTWNLHSQCSNLWRTQTMHSKKITLNSISKEIKRRRPKKSNVFLTTQTRHGKRVHRLPFSHKFRVDTRSYKWLEASQRQNGPWVLKFWCPTGCNGSEGRLYGL